MPIAKTLHGAPPAGERIWFTAPAHLQKIDFDEAPESRMRRTYENAAALYRDASPEERARIVLSQEVMLARLLDEGVVYAAHCLARSEADPARLVTAEFSIAVKHVELPPGQSLSILANGLRQPGSPRAVATVSYPAGEAVVVGEELEVRPAALASGRPNSETYRMRQARVLLPFPGRRRIVLLRVTSTDLADWQHFVAMLNDLAHSLSFTEPSDGGLSDVLDGL